MPYWHHVSVTIVLAESSLGDENQLVIDDGCKFQLVIGYAQPFEKCIEGTMSFLRIDFQLEPILIESLMCAELRCLAAALS